MATYYWTGKVSSNVQDANNWSLWGPSSGITLPASAPSKPVDNSDVIFAKYPSTFPIYGPAGFLSGTSGGTAAVTIATLQVKPDFNKDIGTSSNYFKFYAKLVDLNRADGGYTLAYIDVVEDPAGICGPDGNATVNIKGRAGVKYFIKGNAWKVNVPTFATQTGAEIYGYGANSYFQSLSNNSKDIFYFDHTTTTPTLYSQSGDDITNEEANQYFFGSPTINIKQGYNNRANVALGGSQLVMNLIESGPSGSNPIDLPPTTFNSLSIGYFSNSMTSTSNVVNCYHEVGFDELNVQWGTINFNDPNAVSVIYSGEFIPEKAVITTSQSNNLEIATLTIKNILGTDTPSIKLYGNYDITAYPNDPLA